MGKDGKSATGRRKGGTKKGLPAQLAAKNAMVAAAAAANTVRAWELRKIGRTVPEIAEELGVSASSAQSYLRRGMELAREQYTASAMDHIQLMVAQLEQIVSKWKDLADVPAAEGADRAAVIVLRALDQKAKLLGLEGKAAGLVMDGQAQVMDMTEALKSPATREALRRMLDAAEKSEAMPVDATAT